MSSSSKSKIKEQREYNVVKANELIQNSRFNLNLQEQKIILYLISKIKPSDTNLEEYSFDIQNFCQVCGIDYDNGKNYQNLKKTLQDLHNKSLWVKINNKTEILFSWISGAAIINEGNGIVQIRLHESMAPYLLELQKNFTKYGLIYILAMKSQYSIRFYETLKSCENLHRKTFTVDELKKAFMCERGSYNNFNNFKTYVLDIAMKEINTLTDISIEYNTLKEGKKVTQVEFTIKLKTEITERLKTFAEIEKILDNES